MLLFELNALSGWRAPSSLTRGCSLPCVAHAADCCLCSSAEVVDLLASDSDSDSDADLLVSPFKRSRPQSVNHGGSRPCDEAAGPSHVGRRLQWELPEDEPEPQRQQQEQQGQQARQLAELCQVSLADAVAALEACGGDIEAAADFILESQQQGGQEQRREAHLQQPVQQQQQQPAQQQQQQQPAQQQPAPQHRPPGQPGAAAAAAAAAAAGAQAGGQPSAAATYSPGAAWPLRQRLALPPLAPGQRLSDAYTVVLLVDSREKQAAVAALQVVLGQQGVAVESRGLPVGDMLWVARDRCAACSMRPSAVP